MTKYNINYSTVWHLGTIAFLLFYIAPLFIYGGELNYLAFDNLDSNVVWYKVLAESGHIFSSNNTIIPNIMGGLPRSSYTSEFDIILWLYYFFSPMHAYILNEFFIHSVAFISMYIFLDNVLFTEEYKHKFIYVNAGALYFATLPFWPSAGLSLPLMPLVTYALLKIEQKSASWYLWIMLAFLPLYSSFILVYLFYLILAALYFIYKTIDTRQFNTHLFLALIFLTCCFLLTDYRLILQTLFDNNFISNRSEYFVQVNNEFIDAYRNSLLQFLDGVPHAKGVHLEILLPTSLFVFLLSFNNGRLSKRDSLIFITLLVLAYFSGLWQNILRQIYTLPLIGFSMILLISIRKNTLLASLLLAQVIIAFWFGFSFYKGWNNIFEYFPFLKMLNFSRFFFISSVLWALIVALIIKIFVEKLRFFDLWVILFMVLQFSISYKNSMFGVFQQLYHLPFEKYYASQQFNEIKQYIGKPQNSYRIINLGIVPAVTQYNGFHTIDGYMVNYPLEYKHTFRKIISPYINNEEFFKNFYDGWGSKLYLYNYNIQYAYYNEFFMKSLRTNSYKKLAINTKQISKMGGEFIFSAQKIIEPEQYDLVYLKTFTHNNSLWPVSVYKVNSFEY